MTKEQAIKQMNDGYTVSHRYFTDEEWVRRDGKMYEFEDGCRCHPREFWGIRSDPSWNEDWKVVN